MKTNEGGAAFGAIGKERSKLLAMIAVIALALCLFAAVPSGEADAEPDYSMPDAVNGVITLDNDVQLEAPYTVSEDVTKINLGNHTISRSPDAESGEVLIVPEGVSVSIDNGTIGGTGAINGITVNGTVELGNDLIVNGYYSLRIFGGEVTTNGTVLNAGYVGVYIANADNTNSSDPSSLEMNGGSITAPTNAEAYGLSGNNQRSAGSVITINGTVIEAAIGIYIPMESEVSINNAVITALVGIEVQMGTVSITGTEFTIDSEYEPAQMPVDNGPITNGSAIIIAAQNYGEYDGQYVSSPDISVNIGEGNSFDTPGYDVDVFNCKDVPSGIQSANVTLNGDVGSVRIINDDSGTDSSDLSVTIADSADVGELVFTGDASVSVNGIVDAITGTMIGPITIGDGAYVGIGDGFFLGDGSELVNGGSIGVSDANGLKAALVAGGVIEVNDDIETSEVKPFYITSDTTINGNGHSVTSTSTEQSSRVFSITGANSDYVIPSDSIVTINDLEVVGPTVVNYTRGITVHDTVGLVLNINGGSVSAGAYAINIGGGNSGLTLNVSGTTVSGWCAFQTHSMVTEANFTDCVLIGTNIQENPASNGFSTIVINDEAVNASEASGDLLFDGCTIVANMTTKATQMAIDIRSMKNSIITLRGSEIDMSETTAPMICMAATNSIIIDGVLDVEGTATIFSENPEDGGTVTGGTINLDEGDVLILNNGTAYSGGIAGPDETTMDLNLVARDGGVTISVGSFIIDGVGSGTLTFSDGVEVEGSNEGMDFIFEGAVTFNNFTESETGSLTFKDAEGNEYTDVSEAIEAGVDIRLGSDTSLSDLPFSTVDMSLEFDYDGTAHSPATGIPFTANDGYTISSVYISEGNCVSGVVPNMAVVAQTNVGTYTIQYTLVITDAQGQSVTYTPTIEWRILPQDVEITHDDISKEYDGTSDVEQSFTADADGLTLGDAYYTDINAGEGKEVRLPIVIAEGSIAENYTFTVNGAEAELMGDAESGYYIVLQGTITQKEITVIVTAPEKEYDGSAYEYAYSSGTDVEGDQLSVAVTTTGVDAGTYTGSSNLKFGDPIIMNGVIDVTDNYIINIDESSTLTIDQRDITISPATGAVITKEYNGWSSRIMSESDFQMSGAIDGDDVSFDWTPGASNIWYNSPNVLEANTLTVNGLFLVGDDSSNYELPNTTVVFVDGENGLTVGITPMILTISNGSDVSIEKTYDNGNTVPSGQIDTNDYSVSAAQNGTYPDIEINAAVFGSVDAGTGLTVYVTDATLVDGDNGVASNFALPEMQTTDDGIQYYFSITGANVKIDPITVDGNMVEGSLSEQDGQIILTVTVTSGNLELTEFASTLSLNDTAIQGTGNSYVITAAGEYKATITSTTDRNWSVASPIEATLPVSFDYTADFYTKDIIDGEFVLEQTVFFNNGSVLTPNATNVPNGYELVGWETSDGTRYDVGVYAPISAIGTDFYAVYEEIGDDPSDPSGPTVTIDMPDSFAVGEVIEFSVSTTKGDYTGGFVQGTGIFEGIPGVDYIIWYKEVNDGKWYLWEDGNFGPSSGFQLSDATSEFRIQFINAGTYDLTVQIVTVDGGDVVCETTAVVDVPAEHSLGYHIQDAVEYTYVDNGEYNANAYTYAAEFTSYANSIIANYGYEYYEALLAYLTNGIESDKAASVMNDFARYMGALYRSSDGDVGRVYFNGNEYVWKVNDKGAWNHGSNWQDVDGDSLVEDVKDYIAATQNTSIVMEIAVPGGERQVLTYGAVFEDATLAPEQYVVKFQDQNGNVIDTVTGLISGSAVLLPRTISVDGETMIVESWTIGTTIILSPDIGYYFVDPDHAVEGTIIMVASYAEVLDPVTVTYYDGAQILKVHVMYPGEFFEFPQISLTDGEAFEGWYSDETFATPAGTSLPENVSGTYSLYAKVTEAPEEETYEIVFMNGDQTLTYGGYTGLAEGTTVALPSGVEGIDASKFRLNGWYLDGKLPMTTYTVRGIDAVDGKITLYADIVQYSFEITENTTKNGTFTTFLQNGMLMIIAFPDSGYAVDTVSVMAGDEALTVVKSSETLFYVSIGSDVIVSVTFKDVSGVQDPEDVSTMVDVSIGSLSDGVQVQLDALVGILPSDVDVSVTYYYEREVQGVTGYGTTTVTNDAVQIPVENNGRWNVDFVLTSYQNYDSAYLGFATVTYTIGEIQYEFESVLTNIIHVPVSS